MGGNRQELGSYGTKLGPHAGDPSFKFAHSYGVCGDVGLPVLILEKSWANWKKLVKISLLDLELQHPWFRRRKLRVPFCSPRLFKSYGYIVASALYLQPKQPRTEIMKGRAATGGQIEGRRADREGHRSMMSRVDTDSVSFMPRMRNQFPLKSCRGHHFRTGGGDLRKHFCPCLFQGLEA